MNPCNRYTERREWLRFQISQELATSIAPGLADGSEAARGVLVEWLTNDRERLVSHCLGGMSACARHAGIEPFSGAEITHEIELVAMCHRVG